MSRQPAPGAVTDRFTGTVALGVHVSVPLRWHMLTPGRRSEPMRVRFGDRPEIAL
ncbi:hypothetical protein MANY_42010 [Mycolicibacterium anyangense]|uniref:Uncharacterized protein n=1 Tax=Mycolicibacterium anyangense TaxID=1431246 RepID=A0A6N4WFJ2_9MYCO|nr:hypothetical protein MANY_42010 [Mycolicibacterium anyangense]